LQKALTARARIGGSWMSIFQRRPDSPLG